MKFTSEIIRTANKKVKAGMSRKIATKLAFKIHSPEVKQVRERLSIGGEFYAIYQKTDGTINKRIAISIREAIERGLYIPAELSAEQSMKMQARADYQNPEEYIKYFDLEKGEPRMAKAVNFIGIDEI